MSKKIVITISIIVLVAAGGYFAYAKGMFANIGVITYTPDLSKLLKKEIPATQSVTLTFAGDIMLDRGVEMSVNKNFAGDFAPLFENAKPLFQSDDITFLNLEGPVSDKGYKAGSIYSFEMNPIVLPVIKNAGVDIVSFANNHVGDYTKAAFLDTLDRLTENNIPYSGAGKTYEEAAAPTIIEKNGLKVGYVSFTDVGPNWLAAKKIASNTPATNPNTPTETTTLKTNTAGAGILLASDPDFSKIISSAKTQVDVLVVSFHWGDEYKSHNARQAKLAHAAVDAGADIIAGHHPHVAQDIEIYKDKLIIYSMGNFVFDQYFSKETMQGLVVRTKVSKDTKTGAITISDTKEYINQLNKFYQIESITEKYPEPKKSSMKATINIGWVGDIPPSTTAPTFDETVLSWIGKNDIMTGNLEGALNSSPSSKCSATSTNCYAFVGNSTFAQSLSSAGFDLFNLANNHTLDKGEAGVAATKSILTAAKIHYAPENGSMIVKTINGVETAFLSFGHNMWTQKITDLAAVKKSVSDAAAKYSAVVVFFHGGAEGEGKTHVTKATEYYIGENRGDVYAFAHTAIDAGADLVLGSGPHVIRGIEKYNDRLIVYSAGNFMATEGMSNKGLTGKAALFNITIDQDGALKSLSILSTTGEIKNAVSADPTNAAINLIAELTKADFGQTITADQNGAITFVK
jgi:poly-gamma-glutamate capsule biosynthesis protein CapA/YwtB (metallophosphatase superfamily)